MINRRSTLARHERNLLRHSSLLAASGLLVLGLARCSDPSAPDRVFSGTAIALGAGIAHTEVTTDNAGDMTSFAIIMNDAALASMPATAMSSIIVPLPDGVAAAPLNHVTLDWNPNGHPPVGIYDKPHFDLHYYMISTQERDAIVPTDPLFAAKVAKQPAADLVAPNYVGDPNGVPRMGVHWTDKTAPERNGQPFTQSAIYGYYDGSMVFVEPMFTYAYLASKPNSTMSIPVPARYEKAGRYPTTFSIHYDAATGTHRLELSGFVTHK